MSGAQEAATGRHQMAATLMGGVETLSENQRIQFTRYRRLVLPIDGSVFWVRADLVQPSALLGVPQFGQVTPAQYGDPGEPVTFLARGSLHYATIAGQAEADANTTNPVVFTSLEEIENFNTIDPDTMWLGAWQGIRFSFARRGNFYEQAKLWHYEGNAVLATMESQIIDSPIDFSAAQIVSNSLPIWLALREPIAPVVGLGGIGWPIYPSFLVPNNLPPPFVAVHIVPEGTMAIQSAPFETRDSDQWQLVQDKVRLTTYGLRDRDVLDLCRYIQNFVAFTGAMGISNMPIPRDLKQPQVELGALAQAKMIDFDVNYYQAVTRGVARQLILIATATIDVIPVRPRRPGRWNEFRWSDGATWA